MLDGVFARERAGALAFHEAPHLTSLDVAEVLATVEPLLTRLLDRRGLGERDRAVGVPDAWGEEAPVLAGLAAASVQGRVALGAHRGARLQRLGHAPDEEHPSEPGGCHVRANGFDLHAGLVVPAGQRDRLEHVCRYALRPPVTSERLHLTEDGQVRLDLRQPWRDGTTAVVFDPVEFLGRLAALVPRPRINLLLYHAPRLRSGRPERESKGGVLGARAAWRAEVVRHGRTEPDGSAGRDPVPATADRDADPPDHAARRARGACWASLMQRTYGVDVLGCPRCGGRLRLIALIDQATVIERILRHLGVPTEVPAARPARAPPADGSGWDDEGPGFDDSAV